MFLIELHIRSFRICGVKLYVRPSIGANAATHTSNLFSVAKSDSKIKRARKRANERASRTDGKRAYCIVNLESDTFLRKHRRELSERASPRVKILIVAVYIHLLTLRAQLSRAHPDIARTLKYSHASAFILLPRDAISDKGAHALVRFLETRHVAVLAPIDVRAAILVRACRVIVAFHTSHPPTERDKSRASPRECEGRIAGGGGREKESNRRTEMAPKSPLPAHAARQNKTTRGRP